MACSTLKQPWHSPCHWHGYAPDAVHTNGIPREASQMNACARWGGVVGLGIGLCLPHPDNVGATGNEREPNGRRQGRGASLGRLEIRNSQWDLVRVEVRAGSAKNCDLNSLVGMRKLARGRAWEIASKHDVCWRREVNPGQVRSPFTGWQRMKPVPGQRRAVQP